MKTYPESRLTDLLIEFDEMGFCPTTVCPHPEQYAIEWKEQIVKEIQSLQAENAELRARLEKAVELPVKVGDKVFAIWEDDIREYKVIETRFVNNTTGITWAISCISMNTNNIIQLFDCHFGVWWFTDPVKAEARLKELQEKGK